MKICFAATRGGHLQEISCLRRIAEENESFLLTESGDFDEREKLLCEKVYYVRQINRREALFIPHFIQICFVSLKILFREKPDCIISTGACATVPIIFLGKIFRKKVIFIESFARVDRPSLTGRLVYPIADVFLIQWEELKGAFPKAIYTGGIF